MVKKNIVISILLFITVLHLSAQNELSKDTVKEEYFIMIIDKPPIFRENGETLEMFITKTIEYHPKLNFIDSTKAKVFVSFWIDSIGNTYNHVVLRGIRDDLDAEAIRVSKLIKFDKPAMQNGKPFKVKVSVPIDFNPVEETKPKKKNVRKNMKSLIKS